MKRLAIVVATMGLAGAAAAQTTLPPPPQGPTLVQCNQGYKDGMAWTRQQFTDACTKLQSQNQGK